MAVVLAVASSRTLAGPGSAGRLRGIGCMLWRDDSGNDGGVGAGPRPVYRALCRLQRGDGGLLQRNLVYTGVTRGKRLVVLVGQRKALAIAVKGARARRRWSKL